MYSNILKLLVKLLTTFSSLIQFVWILCENKDVKEFSGQINFMSVHGERNQGWKMTEIKR